MRDTINFKRKSVVCQFDPSRRLKDRLKWESYKSRHMMYLRKEDLVSAENLRKFIEESLSKPGQPAKH
ncbi:MAG TPA: hypothetical protein VGN20_10665 [Mucilaginibacter sp.]